MFSEQHIQDNKDRQGIVEYASTLVAVIPHMFKSLEALNTYRNCNGLTKRQTDLQSKFHIAVYLTHSGSRQNLRECINHFHGFGQDT